MRVGGQTLARVATLIDSHQLSSSFDRALTYVSSTLFFYCGFKTIKCQSFSVTKCIAFQSKDMELYR